MIAISLFIIYIISSSLSAESVEQYLENIDYQVMINKDGSVKDITKGKNKELTQISQAMNHVTKDCYYALNVSSNKFEIAWGIGMDKEYGRRKYQISYVVNDVITDYKDCQEIHVQLTYQKMYPI